MRVSRSDWAKPRLSRGKCPSRDLELRELQALGRWCGEQVCGREKPARLRLGWDQARLRTLGFILHIAENHQSNLISKECTKS